MADEKTPLTGEPEVAAESAEAAEEAIETAAEQTEQAAEAAEAAVSDAAENAAGTVSDAESAMDNALNELDSLLSENAKGEAEPETAEQPDAAEAEADYLLNLIKGRDIQCGVWYDMEDADFYKQRHHVTDSKTISAMCQRFCKKVQDAGYHVGIYASYSWFKEGIISGCDEYDKWVAHWGNNDGTLHQDFSGFASIPLHITYF